MILADNVGQPGDRAAPAAGVSGLWSHYRRCQTTRDYIDLGLDCADEVLRVPRTLLGWVHLSAFVPQLGRQSPTRSAQQARLGLMDQVGHLEATLADCEHQILAFEQIETRLLEDAGRCRQRGDMPQLKRLWEEVRTCRERLQLEEARRVKVRTWQQELWREAHALQDVEDEHRALEALEQVNAGTDARRARTARLEAAMTRAQLVREERDLDTAEEGGRRDFAAFCAELAGSVSAAASEQHTDPEPQLA